MKVGLLVTLSISMRTRDVIFDTPIYTDGEMDDITVEVAMQYTTGYHENVTEFRQ